MRTAAALVFAFALAGCSSGAPAAPAAGGGMPFHIDRLLETFDGVAADVVQVPSYTYIAVTTDAGDVRWAVSLKKDVAVGARVHVKSFGTAHEFHSKALDRTFAKLWFSVVTQQQGGQS